MKSTELRIGNLVNIIGLVPTQITAKHIVLIDEGDEQYDPIPLTEEILLKCGFKNNDAKWKDLYTCKDLSIWHYKERSSIMLHLFNQKNINYYYLHQLQNLYFALTSEELEVNL